MSAAPEPYVGPRPFDRRDHARFFGRDRETDDLLSLVLAHPVVLIYAASGAGKSSLLNAGLIPRLIEEEFQVLGPARVTGPLPPEIGAGGHVHRFHALSRWNNDLPAPVASAAELGSLSVAEFLQRAEERESGRPRALLFDQFEEFFASQIEQTAQRRAFMEELSAALRSGTRRLRVVFAMREEYVAQFEPFAHGLPDKLRTRMRLEPLRARAAVEAIRRPLETLDLSFEEGPNDPAEALVSELLKIHFDAAPGQVGQTTGEFVEPVQLQVVCRNMWHNFSEEIKAFAAERQAMPPETERPRKIITHEQVRIGDVDQALAQHYDRAIGKALLTGGASEGQLRRWFASSLITPAGARGITLSTSEETAELPPGAVEVFLAQRLVRQESRGGSVWYELTHDRFIEPVQRSNQTWIEQRAVAEALRRKLEAKAETAGALLDESETREAEAFLASEEAATLGTSPAVATLVEASRAHVDEDNARQGRELEAAQKHAAMQSKVARRARRFGLAAGLAALVSVGFWLWAASMQRQAEIQGLASYLTGEAFKQQKDKLDLSLLLSIEAWRVAATMRTPTKKLEQMKSRLLADAKSSLVEGLVSSSHLLKFAHGHEAGVRSIISRKDGRVIITGAEDGTVVFWNESFIPLTPPLKKHTGTIYSFALSPDERTLASASADGAILLWDMTNFATQRDPVRLNPEMEFSPPADVLSVAFSPDGRMLIAADFRGMITLWDVAGMRLITSVAGGHKGQLHGAIFHPAGEVIASCGADHKIGLWKLESGNLVPWKELAGHAGEGGAFVGHPETSHIFTIAFSPDGAVLVSAGQEGTVVRWRMTEAEPKAEPLRTETSEKAHRRGVYALAFSLDGKTLATGSKDQRILLWDAVTGAPMNIALNGSAHGVSSIAFVRQGNQPGGRLLAGMATGAITIWQPDEVQATLASHLDFGNWVYRVAFDPSGRKLASAVGEAGGLFLTDLTTYDHEELKGHTAQVTSFAFAPDGSTCAAGGVDGKILVWPLGAGQPATALPSTGRQIFALTYSPDSKLLVTSGADDEIAIWDVASGKLTRSLPRQGSGLALNLTFSRDGRTLAATGQDRSVALWRVEDWHLLGTLDHERSPASAAFSPDGQTLAIAVWSEVELWNVETQTSIAVLKKHDDQINRVAFSPDGETLASASNDKSVVLWNAATRQPLAVLSTGNTEIYDLAFSPDGRTLAAGTRHTVLWDVNFDSWQCRAAEIAGRNLTREEWATYLQDEPYRATIPNGLLMEAHQHALRGETEPARDAFARTVEWAASIKDARLNNAVAWVGTLDGYASIVLPACDAALREAPLWMKWMVLDTRGIALASTGKLSEAAENLEGYLAWAKEKPALEDARKQREAWVAELRAGRNPIDAKALEGLRITD